MIIYKNSIFKYGLLCITKIVEFYKNSFKIILFLIHSK